MSDDKQYRVVYKAFPYGLRIRNVEAKNKEEARAAFRNTVVGKVKIVSIEQR